MSQHKEAVTPSTALAEYEQYMRECKANFMPDSDIQPCHVWICNEFPTLANVHAIWPDVKADMSEEVLYSDANLAAAYYESGEAKNSGMKDCVRHNIIDRYADELATKIQFPRDTAYLTALGVVASAMTKSFYYKLNKEDAYSQAPVNLYVVSGQPPGTAKSGVFKNLVHPIKAAYIDFNKEQQVERAKIKEKIEEAKSTVKNAKNDDAKRETLKKMQELEVKLSETPVYIYAVDDATSEGLRDLSVKQNGMINMVSEESDLVNVLLGNVYGDGRRKSNNSMFLKAWDGEMISVARAGADPVSVEVKASLVVLAQDEAIKSILEAGMGGRGINERVLIIRERDMLDTIDYRSRRTSSVDRNIRTDYSDMVRRMVFAQDTIFTLSDDANEALITYMEEMQVLARLNPEYRDPTIQGVISKGEKQICKLASVIHAADSWDDIQGFDLEISETATRRAIGIFRALTEQYIRAAQSQGYAGDKPRCERVVAYLDKVSERRKRFVSLASIRDSVKAHESFTRVESVTNKLRNDVLPALEKAGKIAVVGDKVYLNPREF